MLSVYFWRDLRANSPSFHAIQKSDLRSPDEEGAMGLGQVLVEIQPQELKFTFELKKQSSCPVQLVNKSTDYVAYKVKTTSPKRYCVRPNTGIIRPRSTCDFTVTMQASKEAPPDMQLKDKFLVQSTVVPYGTTDEDIVPSFFSKENGRYIQENKLRVVLVSPPQSPVVEPITGHEAANEVPILRKTSVLHNGAPKHEAIHENPLLQKAWISSNQALNEVPDIISSPVAKDIDDLKFKLNNLEAKLNEAEKTIMSLRKENNATLQEGEKLQQEIALLRRKSYARVQAGFPFLFVVFIAFVGMTLGYLLHS